MGEVLDFFNLVLRDIEVSLWALVMNPGRCYIQRSFATKPPTTVEFDRKINLLVGRVAFLSSAPLSDDAATAAAEAGWFAVSCEFSKEDEAPGLD